MRIELDTKLGHGMMNLDEGGSLFKISVGETGWRPQDIQAVGSRHLKVLVLFHGVDPRNFQFQFVFNQQRLCQVS